MFNGNIKTEKKKATSAVPLEQTGECVEKVFLRLSLSFRILFFFLCQREIKKKKKNSACKQRSQRATLVFVFVCVCVYFAV